MSRQGDFELITLKTGKRAVRHVEHGEVMHPAVGPWEEANRLYVQQMGLVERLMEPTSKPLRILDLGLGGAANASSVLTCAASLSKRLRPLELVSLENDLNSLRLALSDSEGFPFLAPWKEACLQLIEKGKWSGQLIEWRLHEGDARLQLQRMQVLDETFDLILFDPFSPSVNAELWKVEVFKILFSLCRENALLATYSAATPTRVSLLLGGFFVGIGSDIGFKSETTLASTNLSLLKSPLNARWLSRWERSSARAPHGSESTPNWESQLRAHPQWQALKLNTD